MSGVPQQWTIRSGPGNPPWAIQFRRTVDTGPPEGLVPGQPAVEMRSPFPNLWIGVPSSVDPLERVLVVGRTLYLPLIGGTLHNTREDSYENPILVIDNPYHPTLGFSQEGNLWWIVEGRQDQFSIYYIDPRRGFTLSPDGDGWFDRALGSGGDLTTYGNLRLNGTADVWGWILRPDIPGFRNLRFAAEGDVPLDNVWINAWQTSTAANLTVWGALTVEQGVSVNGGDLWVRNRVVSDGGVDVWGGQLFVNNALIAHTSGGVEIYNGLQVFGYATLQDGMSQTNWYVPDGWIYGREVNGEWMTAGELWAHRQVSAHDLIARNDLYVDGVAFLRGGRTGLSSVYPGVTYGLIVRWASEFSGMVDVVNPGNIFDSVRLAPDSLYAQVWVACSASGWTDWGPPGARISCNIPGGGQWLFGAETDGSWRLIRQNILANEPRDEVIHADHANVHIYKNFSVAGQILAGGPIAANGSITSHTGNIHAGLGVIANGDLFIGQSATIMGELHVANGIWTSGSNLHIVWDCFMTASLVVGGHDINNYVCRINPGAVMGGVNWMRLFGYAEKIGGGEWLPISSDRRTKTDIAPYRAGLDAIRQLEPSTFRYNGLAETLNDGVTYTGLLAQDVAPAMPEMVVPVQRRLNRTDAADSWVYTLDYSLIKFALVNAVKELDRENADLKQRVAELEARVR